MLHSPSSNEKPPLCFLHLAIGMYSNFHLFALALHLHTQQYSDQVTMVLELNNTHTVYYHAGATWSVGLVQTYFTHQ